jgi:ribosomal protein L18E
MNRAKEDLGKPVTVAAVRWSWRAKMVCVMAGNVGLTTAVLVALHALGL